MAKLISLQGATITVPNPWTATAGYGIFTIDYNYSNDYIDMEGLDTLYIGYDGTPKPIANKIYDGMGSYFGYSVSFEIVITGGTDVTNESLIQWFLDNNATIEGGIYEEEHTVQIINPQMYILPATKVVGNDLVVVAEEVVVNDAEEPTGYTVAVTSNYSGIIYDDTTKVGTVSAGGSTSVTITSGILRFEENSASMLKTHTEIGGVTYVSWDGSFEIDGRYPYLAHYTVSGDGTISLSYGQWSMGG